MLNILWPIFIIISFSYAIFFGNLNNLNSEIFASIESAIKLSINLLGTICLWNGIMQIASKTSIIDKLTKFLKPVINFLFPELRKNSKIQKEISMNMVANILGLDRLTDSMAMFIVINTASIQIIPTTVIAIRNSLGSENPTSIIFPVWIATICAAVAGIIAVKILINITNNKEKK